MLFLSQSDNIEQYFDHVNNPTSHTPDPQCQQTESDEQSQPLHQTVSDDSHKLMEALSKPPAPTGRRICSLNLKKGRKYYVSGETEKKETITFIVDSGADISILPTSMVSGLSKSKVNEPIEVRGFNGEVGASITEKVEVEVNFQPGNFKAPFYVCEAPFAIIATDLLQAGSLKLSLSTGDAIFNVRDVDLKTKSKA